MRWQGSERWEGNEVARRESWESKSKTLLFFFLMLIKETKEQHVFKIFCLAAGMGRFYLDLTQAIKNVTEGGSIWSS